MDSRDCRLDSINIWKRVHVGLYVDGISIDFRFLMEENNTPFKNKTILLDCKRVERIIYD